jgi:hypothetical protein
MLITELCKRRTDGVVRIEARLIWETADRAPVDLFIETEERWDDLVTVDPSSLLGAVLLPAWHYGETRVRIEGQLCPYTCERLKVATGFLVKWFPKLFPTPVPVIEATGGIAMRTPPPGQSVALLSCGIDSLATLRWNKVNVPADHPDAITTVLYYNYDKDTTPSRERLLAVNAPRRPAVEAVAADAGCAAIPVRSNLYHMIKDGYFYTYQWHGATNAAILGAFSAGFRRGYIASSHCPVVVQPYGSHPLLDPYFSSAHFAIEHDLFSMGRFDKVALVSEWPAGLANIRVCQNDSNGGHNCGTCEKCIRTLTMLTALGRQEGAAAAFPDAEVTPELIRTIDQYDMIRGHPYYLDWYGQLVPMLKQRGREPVAIALEAVLASAMSGPPPAH